MARNNKRIFEYKPEIDNLNKIRSSLTKDDLHKHIRSKDKKMHNKHIQKVNEKSIEKYESNQEDIMKRIDSSGA